MSLESLADMEFSGVPGFTEIWSLHENIAEVHSKISW